MAVTVGLLAYDIADTRQRQKVRRLLEAYGIPVQESVFLLELPRARWREVEQKLRAITDRVEDDVRVWPLCAQCVSRGLVWCGAPRRGPGALVIV
jgi:CRISPR-associated protein Cas2